MILEDKIYLKKSRYNLTLPAPVKGVYIIYNTLQDSLTLVKGKKFNTDDILHLYQQGVYVNQAIDERLVYRYRLNLQKYTGKRLHLFLTITGLCNCDCQYCFAKDSFSQYSMKQSDISCIIKFIEIQIAKHGIKKLNIDFFGGEPLICEGIYLTLMGKISDVAGKAHVNVEFQFYTNGTLRPRNGYSVFESYPNVRFLITIDGLQEVHDSLRPMKNGTSSYESIFKNLQEIKSSGLKAVIRINFGKKNIGNVPELLDNIIENGLNCFPIEFYPIQNMSCGSADYSDAVDLPSLPRMSKYIWSEATKKGIPIGLRPVSSCCYCTAFTNKMFVIDPDLNVYKCALLQCDRKNAVGNLKKNTDFLRDSVFYEWMTYDPSREDQCNECTALPVCSGGCGGSGTFRFGSHKHANCYDLSPEMLKTRIAYYIAQHYKNTVVEFSATNASVLVLEKSKHSIL